jgi:hypothetical protein
MAKRRILIEADGDVRMAVVPDPLLSSGATTWKVSCLNSTTCLLSWNSPAHH